MFKVKMYY